MDLIKKTGWATGLALLVIVALNLSADAASVVLRAPLNGHATNVAYGGTITFTFQYDDTDRMDTFSLMLCRDSNLAVISCTQQVDSRWITGLLFGSTNTYAGTITLPTYSDSFYWRVVAYDSSSGAVRDSAGPQSIVYDTQTDTSRIKAPSSAHQTTVRQNLVLEWTAVSDSVGIDSFALYVSSGDTFKHLAFVDTVDGTITADTVTATLTGWDTYFWYVATIDHLGNKNKDSYITGWIAIVGDSVNLDPTVSNTATLVVNVPNGNTHGTGSKYIYVKTDTGISTLTAYAPSCSVVLLGAAGDTIRIYIKTNGPSGTAGIVVRFPADTEFDSITAAGASDSTGKGGSYWGWQSETLAQEIVEGTLLALSFLDTSPTALTDLTAGVNNQTYSYILEWELERQAFNTFLSGGGDTNSLSVYSASSINGTYSSIAGLTFISDTNGIYVFRSSELTSASFKFIGVGGGSAKIEFPGTCVVERHVSSPRALAGLRALRDSTLATSWGRRLTGWFYRF